MALRLVARIGSAGFGGLRAMSAAPPRLPQQQSRQFHRLPSSAVPFDGGSDSSASGSGNGGRNLLLAAAAAGAAAVAFAEFNRQTVAVAETSESPSVGGPTARRRLSWRERRFLQFASLQFNGAAYLSPLDFLESVALDASCDDSAWQRYRKCVKKHMLQQ